MFYSFFFYLWFRRQTCQCSLSSRNEYDKHTCQPLKSTKRDSCLPTGSGDILGWIFFISTNCQRREVDIAQHLSIWNVFSQHSIILSLISLYTCPRVTWPTLILTTMEMVTLSTVYVKWVSETLLRPSGILFNTLCVPIIIVRVTLHPETPYISGIQIQTDSFCQRRHNVGPTSATLDRRCSCTGCVAHPHGSEPRSTHWGSGSRSDKH